MNPEPIDSKSLTRRQDIGSETPEVYSRGGRETYYAVPSADAAGSPSSGAGASMADIFRRVKQHKWRIALAGVLGVVLGVASYVLQPIVYPARTTVEVLGINENFMNFNLVDPQAGSGVYSATNSNIQTQIRIIESAELRKRVLDRLRLSSLPSQTPTTGWAQKLRVRLGIVEGEPVAAMRQALNMAILTTKAGALRETRIIEIRCQSTSPEVAATYLNTLVSEYADQALEVRSNTARKTMEWLSNQLRDAKERLDQSAAKMAEFERTSGYTATTPGDTLAASKLRQLRAELAVIQADRIAKQTRYDKIRNTSPDRLIEVVEDAALRSKEAQIQDLRRQLADLRTTLTPSHFRVQRLMAQLNEVENDARRERQTIIDRARIEVESALAKERALQGAHSVQTGASVAESTQAAQRQSIQREIDLAQQTYNGLLQQSTQAGMVAAVPSIQARAVDLAESSMPPLGLGVAPRVVLGWMVGCFLGIAFVVTRELMNRTVRTSRGVVDLLRIPELGVIPSSAGPETGGRWLKAGKSDTIIDAEASPAIPDSYFNANKGMTMFAESFRTTLASLMFNAAQRRVKGAPTYVISSPGPAEGKTFVTANLGIAIAETGRRVVLVDMDLRRPGLSTFFSMENRFGLGDLVLSEGNELEEGPVAPFAHPTSVSNLFLLSAGNQPGEKMAGLLYNPRLGTLLAKLAREFDFVLIDTAPLGLFADARVVGHLSDGVILVLRAEQTTRDSAMDARRKMEEDGTPLIGMILNDSRTADTVGYYMYHTGSGSGRKGAGR